MVREECWLCGWGVEERVVRVKNKELSGAGRRVYIAGSSGLPSDKGYRAINLSAPYRVIRWLSAFAIAARRHADCLRFAWG